MHDRCDDEIRCDSDDFKGQFAAEQTVAELEDGNSVPEHNDTVQGVFDLVLLYAQCDALVLGLCQTDFTCPLPN